MPRKVRTSRWFQPGLVSIVRKVRRVAAARRRREEIVARLEQPLEMRDHPFELFLRRGRQQVLGRRLRQATAPSPVLRPFVGAQDHRLGEVERGERRVDRHGDDRARQRHVLGLEPRALGPEQDRAAARLRGDLARGRFGREHRLGHAALAHRGGIDMRAIGDRFGHVSKTCAPASTSSAPAAAGPASGLGQPSRGATRRISVSPKLSIARAALPMFSPSCGRTRTMMGGVSRPRHRARCWRIPRSRALREKSR